MRQRTAFKSADAITDAHLEQSIERTYVPACHGHRPLLRAVSSAALRAEKEQAQASSNEPEDTIGSMLECRGNRRGVLVVNDSKASANGRHSWYKKIHQSSGRKVLGLANLEGVDHIQQGVLGIRAWCRQPPGKTSRCRNTPGRSLEYS